MNPWAKILDMLIDWAVDKVSTSTSSSSYHTVENSEKEEKGILRCDICSFTCVLKDFANDELFCPDCGSRLIIESE